MKKAIHPLPQRFDSLRIRKSVPDEIWHSDDFQQTYGQLSVTHSEASDSLYDSIGSTYDREVGKFVRKTSDYTTVNKIFKGTYLEEVIEEVKKQAASDGVCIGRVRFLLLKPKTCYSWHWDPDEFRYHIPLRTSEQCFFVSGESVERMPEVGRLYRFDTKEYHTAINGSLKLVRYHLVFDTYINSP